jgi:hypothetical protein
MEDLRLGDQLARFDRERTVSAYLQLQFGDADRCRCVWCRNFAAQRSTVYPETFLNLLQRIGIDPGKEGEVYDMAGPDDRRVRSTGGWFYFVGELVEKGEKSISERAREGEFSYWLGTSFPRPPACFGERVAALEFVTDVSWVLREDPGGGG